MPFVTVLEAAVHLGVSPQTVKRRLKSGKLKGRQEATAQGFTWLVDVPDISSNHQSGTPTGASSGVPSQYADIPSEVHSTPVGTPDDAPGTPGDILRDNSFSSEGPSLLERVAALSTEVEGQRALIASLNEQVDSLKGQLGSKDRQIEQLHVLVQQAQAALPAPKEQRSWWRRLWGG
jgi:hypothetical protein